MAVTFCRRAVWTNVYGWYACSQPMKAQMKAEQHASRLVLAAKLVQTKSDRMSRDFPWRHRNSVSNHKAAAVAHRYNCGRQNSPHHIRLYSKSMKTSPFSQQYCRDYQMCVYHTKSFSMAIKTYKWHQGSFHKQMHTTRHAVHTSQTEILAATTPYVI